MEAETEAVKMSNRFMVNENNKLRHMIDVYIRSAELNDPVWEVMKNDDMFNSSNSNGNQVHSNAQRGGYNHRAGRPGSASEALSDFSLDQGFRRKDVVDAGQQQLKALNRLDIETNEILANILKEENRQRLLMKDVLRLIGKNSHLFAGGGSVLSSGSGSVISHIPHLDIRGNKDGDDEYAGHTAAVVAAAKAFAADHKPFNASAIQPGKVGNLRGSMQSPNRRQSSFLMSALASGNSNGTGGGPTGAAAAASQGMVDTCDIAIQVDEKDDYGLRLDNIEDNEVLDTLAMGVAPLAPMNVYMPGLDQPYMIRQCMATFPKVLRVPPVAWTCQTILSVYLDKLEDDEERVQKKLPKLPLPVHMYNFFKRIYGLETVADVQVAQLVKACETQMNKQPRISLFVSQIGLLRKEDLPPMDVRDTDFVLTVLKLLQQHGELQSEMTRVMSHKSRSGTQKVSTQQNQQVSQSVSRLREKEKDSLPNNIAHVSVYVKPEISRAVAVTITQKLFEKWLPDGGEDFVIKVKSMQQSGEHAAKIVDLDLFIETLIEPWQLVRWTWEEHARFLFKNNCGVYRVLQEATFANDEGLKASDTLLAEMSRVSTFDCIRRPLRMFQIPDEDAPGNNNSAAGGDGEKKSDRSNKKRGKGGGGKGSGGGGGWIGEGNPNKEPVVEMINRQKFGEVLLIINPNIPLKLIDQMFDEALEMAHQNVMRILEVMWRRFIDKPSNYTNSNRPVTQADFLGRQGRPALTQGDANAPLVGNDALTSQQQQVQVTARTAGSAPTNRYQLGTNREFFVNMRTGISQWSRPFWPRTFHNHDLDMDTFVQILVRYDMFPRSPFLEFLHLSPGDLWPNADTFYKQILEREAERKRKELERERERIREREQAEQALADALAAEASVAAAAQVAADAAAAEALALAAEAAGKKPSTPGGKLGRGKGGGLMTPKVASRKK